VPDGCVTGGDKLQNVLEMKCKFRSLLVQKQGNLRCAVLVGIAVATSMVTDITNAEEQKYVCITDYALGIIEREGKTIVTGNVALRSEQQKFFVTINERQPRNECFSKEQMEVLKDNDPEDLC
jgi:hypothetical protein